MLTVLPWHNESELAFVRDCFYPHHNTDTIDPYSAIVTDTSMPNPDSPSTPSYTLGLRRFNIWTFKSPRTVPRAVTATAKLIDALVHDQLYQTPSPSPQFRISRDAMKSIYAMAFMRFVNAFVDRDVIRFSRSEVILATETSSDEDEYMSETRTQAKGESSMYANAATIGMPAAMVDLRHRCVHGDVPGLPVLRAATERALEWLWVRWWKGHASGDAMEWRMEMEEEARKGDGGLSELRVDV